ncbi:hypothetical protein IFR05_012540, partial [Cadophora sp. M221]
MILYKIESKAMYILNIVLLALVGNSFGLSINRRPFPKVDCRIATCAEEFPDCCTLPDIPEIDPEPIIITDPIDDSPFPIPGFGGDPDFDPDLTTITGPFHGNPLPLPRPGFGGDPVKPFGKRENALEERIFNVDMPLEMSPTSEDTHGCSDGCHPVPGGGSGGG